MKRFTCSKSRDEIKALDDITELCAILDSNEVKYDSLETEEEIRDLVLKCMRDSEPLGNGANGDETDYPSRHTGNTDEVLRRILDRDAEMKQKVKEIYIMLLEMLQSQNFREGLDDEIKLEYNGYEELIETYIKQLQKRECPIVVAGETSAGKSSLLNLILGKQVLPKCTLSSTSTICQVFHSDTKKAVVHKMNGETEEITDVTEVSLSRYVSQDMTERKTQEYKRVDIYWPIPMLQNYATLVDTPGIGESDEMTNILLDFLKEAMAFIYVINTPNAGGVQTDRLVMLFQQQQKWEEKGRLLEFDPNCAIFVCNKWDQVPLKEETKVWEDIAKKLGEHWPVGKDINIENHMFKMCTREELRRHKTGLGYTEKYRKLLSGIENVIPASLETRVRRHVVWIDKFLNRVLVKIIARINATKKNMEEKRQMEIDVEKRLKKLKHNTDEVKEKMQNEAKKACDDIAERLYQHLSDDRTQAQMFAFQEGELPDGSDLEVIKYKARQIITDNINREIRKWCRENDIAETSKKLFNLFKEECKLIEGHCAEIDSIIQGIEPPIDGSLPRGLENSADSESKGSIFPIQERLALMIFAPLWLPLVIGASVIALPVAIGMVIKDSVEEKQKLKKYRNNKTSFVVEWAKEEVKLMSKDVIFAGLENSYLKSFNSHLDELCEDVIPKLITADEQLISNIVNEERDSVTVRKQFQPMEKKCKDIIGHLLILKLENFSGERIQIREKGNLLGRGNYSDVHKCTVQIGEKVIECAVKTMKYSLNQQAYLQLTEVNNLRSFNNENIVTCFGIAIEEDARHKKYLNILMEICENTLEDILICSEQEQFPCECHPQRKLTCHVFKNESSKEFRKAWEFFISMLMGIINGLVYLHGRGFVHRDLKLTNVLVKENEAKIADVGMAKREDMLSGTIIGTPVAMAPEVLAGDFYGKEADIYSLSIMIWEMWYGRKVFSEVEYSDVLRNFQSIKEHIWQGTRPRFESQYPPPEKLRALMMNCWGDEESRPKAEEIRTSLVEINGEVEQKFT